MFRDGAVGLSGSRIACWTCKLPFKASESIKNLTGLECPVTAPSAPSDDRCLDELGDGVICRRNTYSEVLR